ncbi:GTP cyclohydrolase I FolE [Candidatus Liberibacter americanus]|uniref:GTP cyclohydrolase 1 n=1 Tax=Candidatus Liberibacter americanus str. Sao Paulo TaxID=1261131 RepID=U6B816_9HYPH|nr:GTP cyclohydrolase I FolE [Candidatus Liberibacter americanus]AHA27872.1 GTP cyclohydrolase I type 1 [Candidatus Liberibacter americanus str. Sao Paulo]EMS35915.1 GTP cyclohydrolase I [Candidatus Liberibacter americanus PW_SP]
MKSKNPTIEEAKEAVRVLLRWIGEDSEREGLKDTPKRVIDSYKELFSGYDSKSYLENTSNFSFGEVSNYRDMVMIKDISFFSYCEHHVLPISGKIHIAYIPVERVIGLSKIIRVLDIYSRRLQIQERLTMQIADGIAEIASSKGVAVLIEGQHMCMSMRGVKREGLTTVTTAFTGEFNDKKENRDFFIKMVSNR